MFSAEANGFALTGDLKAGDVAQLYAQGLRDFAASDAPIRIDLGGVGTADSAVLAMLVEWAAWARRHERSLEFRAVPERLRALAALSDVDHWLFESSESAAGAGAVSGATAGAASGAGAGSTY